MFNMRDKICFAPEGESGASEAAPGNEDAAFDWGDLPEEVSSFVEGKTPQEAIQAALSERDTHKQGATRRREQIAEELGSDEDFAKTFSEKRGLVSSLMDDAAFAEFAKQRISEDAKYTHPDIEGADQEMLDTFSSAARESGVSPSQYKSFMGAAIKSMQEKATSGAEALTNDLKEEWGEDYEEKNVHIEAYLNAIGDEKAGDIIAVIARFPPAQQKKAAETLAYLGGQIGTAERDGDGSAFKGGGSANAEDDWRAINEIYREKGGYDNMTEAEVDRHRKAFQAYKAKKEAA